MRKVTFILFFISLLCQSQEVDSLKILKENDWYTLQWFDKDTVVLLPRKKTKINHDGEYEIKILKQNKRELYGERISFNENGEITYTNNMSCPVGESIKQVHTIELTNNILIVDFESTKWPWKKNESIRKKRRFEVIKWGTKCIVLK